MNGIDKQVEAKLETAEHCVKQLWKIKRYLDLLISHYAGAFTEEQFSELAEKFIEDRNEFPDDELRKKISYLNTILCDLDYNDIADILHANVDKVWKITEEMKK